MRATLTNTSYWLQVTGYRFTFGYASGELARLSPGSVQDAGCHSIAFFSNLISKSATEEQSDELGVANLLSDIICPALCALRPAPCALRRIPHTPYPK